MRASFAVAKRVGNQLRRDPRTLALIFVLPAVLMSLLYWILSNTGLFDRIAHAVLGVFPFLVMFLVASVTTLRERSSGTLERALTMPVRRIDIIGGYTLTFSLVAVAQTLITVVVCTRLLDLVIEGSLAAFVVVALLSALTGTTAGLLASAFARTEFQVMQFVPAAIVPQFLLCGVIVPREEMPHALELLSHAMPISYVVDAMLALSNAPTPSAFPKGDLVTDIAILSGFCAAFVVLGAVSLRRKTP